MAASFIIQKDRCSTVNDGEVTSARCICPQLDRYLQAHPH